MKGRYDLWERWIIVNRRGVMHKRVNNFGLAKVSFDFNPISTKEYELEMFCCPFWKGWKNQDFRIIMHRFATDFQILSFYFFWKFNSSCIVFMNFKFFEHLRMEFVIQISTKDEFNINRELSSSKVWEYWTVQRSLTFNAQRRSIHNVFERIHIHIHVQIQCWMHMHTFNVSIHYSMSILCVGNLRLTFRKADSEFVHWP